MNFGIDLAHRGVSEAQWLEHWSARNKTKKHLSLSPW